MESVRELYDVFGSDNYYLSCAESDSYINRHNKQVDYLLSEFMEKYNVSKDSTYLDLACGNGEVTNVLTRELGINLTIQGVDPYLYRQYTKHTNKECIKMDFKGIAQGELASKIVKPVDYLICSFALHLCEESLLSTLLYRLKEISSGLVIITPHKRPDCDNKAGWCLVDSIRYDRVMLNYYL